MHAHFAVAGATILATVAGGAEPQQGPACANVVSRSPRGDVVKGTPLGDRIGGLQGNDVSNGLQADASLG
jgi:hypothetical protein